MTSKIARDWNYHAIEKRKDEQAKIALWSFEHIFAWTLTVVNDMLNLLKKIKIEYGFISIFSRVDICSRR
jgi:hypothetical protein